MDVPLNATKTIANEKRIFCKVVLNNKEVRGLLSPPKNNFDVLAFFLLQSLVLFLAV
jgi:hypothetical protein